MKINLLSSENQRLNIDVKSKEVKTEPDVKPKVITKPNKEHEQDVKPNIKFNRESNQDVKKPDLLSVEKRSKINYKITYEEEKVALILGITSVFTVWWMFK